MPHWALALVAFATFSIGDHLVFFDQAECYHSEALVMLHGPVMLHVKHENNE